jgi:SAM-dependent methyltransferase
VTGSYPDALNPDLLERIPLDAAHVLDVGCGAGRLGQEFKRRNPKATVFGVESHPEAAAVARGRLDRVVVTDIEANPFPFGDTRFDCIVYGDVLEHLRDPWRLLALHAERLNEHGVVVICMPNAEHWSLVERLLRGTFDYDDHGLFDRTHLRWFTPETTQRALRGAGLLPYDVIPRIFDRDNALAFARAMRPALDGLGIDADLYAQRAQPLQHVWRALARPVERLHIVSSMLAPVGGVSHVRVVEPMAALATRPGLLARIVPGFDPGDLPDDPRIFILHRPLLAGPQGLLIVRQLLDRGFVVVCEFDDHPGYIPVLQRPDVHNFSAVHAIQTTTGPLAAVLGQQNPEIAIFPNALTRVHVPRNFQAPGRLTLFFGGLNREEEWPPYIEALNAVAALAGERLLFRIVADRGLFDALQTPHKQFTPLCDYETYQDLLAQSEICLMPLADTPFNRCKSDLKFIEAASFRVAALATPTVYGDSIENGRTGLIFHDAAELRRQLAHLVADPGRAQALADAAREEVAGKRMLAYQLADREGWYRSLWARREELNRALLERVPELAQSAEVLHAEAERRS